MTAIAATRAAPSFAARISSHLRYTLGIEPADATARDLLRATSVAVREELLDRVIETRRRQRGARSVAYVSMEFLVGRSLVNNLISLGLYDEVKAALASLGASIGVSIDTIADLEDDAALGNGGLGRLAACFLDSLATLDLPATGYGLNYEYGLFRQEIHQGEQHERPDAWGRSHSPWLIERPDDAVLVPIYGRVVDGEDAAGTYNPQWLDWRLLVGVPHDLPIAGHGGRTVNTLRLFSARSAGDLDMAQFNAGDYARAVEDAVRAETVSKVLYPSDNIAAGRELRLVQEYFLSACAVRDVVNRCLRDHATDGDPINALGDSAAFQLNDTHPALIVAELMRLLVDEHGLAWDRAWQLTQAVTAYTNHTLMPEALERWPVPLLAHVIPRHLEIIFEINRRFLDEVAARWPGDHARAARMSLIEESEPKHVRMAHLAIVGSHSVNGVAAMHSELVKHELVPDFHALWPTRFNNKTNGVTPRRWLHTANPRLAGLLDDAVGAGWVRELDRVRAIEPLADDAGFRHSFDRVKRGNKERLAATIHELTGWRVDPSAMFDVHIKRIHEYKRQLLNALDVIRTYQAIVDRGVTLPAPRVCIFAGKAAPGYHVAKRIIHLINAIAETVNHDRRVGDQLKVVFLPDYRVSLAEQIIPAADLSEQISTAGTEASGTGNMKMAINGAVTIGTLDGANVEIRDAVGDDAIFLCGLTIEEIRTQRRCGYDPLGIAGRDPALRRVLEAIDSGAFTPRMRDAFHTIRDRLFGHGDEYFVVADFASYGRARDSAVMAYADRERWLRMAIRNTARTGQFSSDRTIREYAADIWNLTAR
jgi:glycogen phosphorylase